MRSDDFIGFLKHLLTVYPSGKIVLIVDNYSSHTAKVVKEWLVRNPRLRLLYLPTYCSHLDPVEMIWLRLKDKVAANRLYNSVKQLIASVQEFFATMTPQQALTWAAIDIC
jgi:transposase